MLKGNTKLTQYGSYTKVFRIPNKVLNDQSFPFRMKEPLVMEIYKDILVIRHKKQGETLDSPINQDGDNENGTNERTKEE